MPDSYSNPNSVRRINAREPYVAIVPGFGRVPGIRQSEKDNCGAECIGIVLRLLKKQQGVQPVEKLNTFCGYKPPVPPRPSGVLTGTEYDIHRYSGRDMYQLAKGCSQAGFPNARREERPDMRALLKTASFANPFIIGVQWTGGGKHAIVCCGYKSGGVFGTDKYCFSDPTYGVLAMDIPKVKSGGSVQPSYVVPTSRLTALNLGAASGFIVNEFVRVMV